MKTLSFKYVLLFLLFVISVGIGWNPRGDIGVFYRVSQYLLSGKAATLYLENKSLGNFFYGPLGLALMKPLALLSFDSAHWIFLALNCVAFFVFWKNLFRLFPFLKEEKTLWFFLAIWAVSIKPIHASFQSFNFQLMIAALLVTFETWMRTGLRWKEVMTGIVLTLLVAIKIFPVFVLAYYCAVRRKELYFGALLGLVLALFLPLLVFGYPLGLTLNVEFVKGLFTYHQAYPLAEGTYLLSFPSLIAWLGKTAGIEVLSIQIGKALVLVTSLLFLGLSWNKRGSPQAWSMAMALMVLLNSVSRVDYFIFYIPAFCSVSEYLLKHTSKVSLALLLSSVVLMTAVSEWTLQSAELNHRLEGWRVPVWGMLVLCSLLTWVLKKESVTPLKGDSLPR